jgi:hypothetical protein
MARDELRVLGANVGRGKWIKRRKRRPTVIRDSGTGVDFFRE